MSIPDPSIIGIKSSIEQIPAELLQQKKKIRDKREWKERWKRCCVCGEVPTKIIQGATGVQRYSNVCVEIQFARI
jgi:hypothetical protein